MNSDIVVFWIVRDSACAECGDELGKGRFLRMEENQPLCLACADLDHLVYLPRGDTALTRRTGKYSRFRAVVVRFSRARRRYERQGILVEEAALDRAEKECLEDSEARERSRARAAERRAGQDAEYVRTFAAEIERLYPRCPMAERRAMAQHACARSSGRIGRTAGARQLDQEAIELAVRAHVRHVHTAYDELLNDGTDRGDARRRIASDVDRVLHSWRGPQSNTD